MLGQILDILLLIIAIVAVLLGGTEYSKGKTLDAIYTMTLGIMALLWYLV